MSTNQLVRNKVTLLWMWEHERISGNEEIDHLQKGAMVDFLWPEPFFGEPITYYTIILKAWK